jgi:putative ABC transport system permease protein
MIAISSMIKRLPKAVFPSSQWIHEFWAAIRSALEIAAGTLWTHKLRTSLTLFGIVVGIAAVVLVGATLGVVREQAVKTTSQTFGANSFIVSQVASSGNLSRKELSDKLRKNPEIYRREAEWIASRINEEAIAAPVLSEVSDVRAGNRLFLAASISGSTSPLHTIRDIRMSSGRFFSETENRRSLGVAVIGQNLVAELFPSVDPIGKHIRIKGRLFAVIGVQEKQGSSFASSLDRNVYIPLRTFEKIWGTRRSVTVVVQPRNPDLFTEIIEQTRFTLRILRRLKSARPDNFDILTPEAGRNFLERLTEMIVVAIIPISSVALFVAGIVVMNMMLVSVTERTREIGIRKSLGARKRDILIQIMFEAVILTVLGGATGLLISYAGTLGLTGVFGSSVRIPFSYAMMALSIAAIIGIGAGIFPAYIASRMPPIEALRSES